LGKPAQHLKDKPLANAFERMGEVIGPRGATRIPQRDRDMALRGCLGLLEAFARDPTKTPKGEISVSLVQYVGDDRKQMRIDYRNLGNTRPVGKTFTTEGLLGHYACAAGSEPRIVNDVRGFKGRVLSPTHSKPEYRPIFILPLQAGVADRHRLRVN
jgi:hypothetical protein